MSVSISRFVNVMSAGKYGKDWAEKPIGKKDSKIGGLLQAMQDELDKVTALGVAVDPAHLKLRAGIERELLDLSAAGTPAQVLAAQDKLKARADKALAVMTAYAEEQQRADERRKLIQDSNAKALSALGNIGQMTNPALARESQNALTALQAEVARHGADTDFSASHHNKVMTALQDLSKQISDLSLATFLNLSAAQVAGVESNLAAAKKNPDSDIGRIAAATGEVVTRSRLRNIEKLKNLHGVDFRPLSPAEVLAIHTYTVPEAEYTPMHQLLLGLIPENPKIRTKIDLCVQALQKMPSYPAAAWPTFRLEDGAKYDWEKQFVTGQVFSTKIFWSTGRTGVVEAHSIVGPRLIITIHGKTGKDIAKMSGAQGEGGGEVLFPPGTKFKTLAMQHPREVVGGKLITPASAKVYITVQEV